MSAVTWADCPCAAYSPSMPPSTGPLGDACSVMVTQGPALPLPSCRRHCPPATARLLLPLTHLSLEGPFGRGPAPLVGVRVWRSWVGRLAVGCGPALWGVGEAQGPASSKVGAALRADPCPPPRARLSSDAPLNCTAPQAGLSPRGHHPRPSHHGHPVRGACADAIPAPREGASTLDGRTPGHHEACWRARPQQGLFVAWGRLGRTARVRLAHVDGFQPGPHCTAEASEL